MFVESLEYSLTIVKVGLDISFSRFQKERKPSVNFVLPDPKSPARITISP